MFAQSPAPLPASACPPGGSHGSLRPLPFSGTQLGLLYNLTPPHHHDTPRCLTKPIQPLNSRPQPWSINSIYKLWRSFTHAILLQINIYRLGQSGISDLSCKLSPDSAQWPK